MSKRWCFFIPVDAFVEGRGHVPSVVEEGVAGHSPLSGNGEFSQPWFWGMTYDAAKAEADAANAQMGLTPLDVAEIVSSSMAASREEGRL